MSAWRIFQSVTGRPFSETDFTYLRAAERPFAVIVNVLPSARRSVARGTCGAPTTYSPPHGLNG